MSRAGCSRIGISVVLLALAGLPVAAGALQAEGAKAEQWTDSDGSKIDPLKLGKVRAAVLLFSMTDCPIANSYAPEVNRIIAKYGPKGVRFFVVYVDPSITLPSARAHAREYGYQCTAVLDPLHTLAKRAGATTSPEAVVIGQKGLIVYRGRVDDRVVSYGKQQPEPKRQDLRLTLDAVLQGKKPPLARTPCVGCVISAPALRKG